MALITWLPKLLDKQNRLPNSRCKCSFIGRNHSVIYLNHCAFEGRFINNGFPRPLQSRWHPCEALSFCILKGREWLVWNLKCALLDRMSKKCKSVRKRNKQSRRLVFQRRCYSYSISRRIKFALWVETWEGNLKLFQLFNYLFGLLFNSLAVWSTSNFGHRDLRRYVEWKAHSWLACNMID